MSTLLLNPQRRKLKRTGLFIGMALLAAAVWTIVRSGNIGTQAWQRFIHASPFLVVALLISIAVIVLCSTLCMLLLTNRTRPAVRVQFVEMWSLICASTLGNFVPLQPGLIGRIAYQHQVNGIAVPISVLITIQSTVLTGIAAMWIGAGLALAQALSLSWVAAILSPILLAPFLSGPAARQFLSAFYIRICETCVWAARIFIVFYLIGQPIDIASALALACVANAANMVPLIGNGIGIREWTIGLLAPLLAGVPLADALAAELVGRCAEIIFFVPAGFAAWPVLRRRLRVHRSMQAVDIVDCEIQYPQRTV